MIETRSLGTLTLGERFQAV
ncbi:hypothetical protein F383_09743 [Gossypium arboreum]|uniref:Uncharacterized protein n=1 Tax=Gossypium arboreum TaxID=29729 RepID=A0A0B0PWU8_GOSAR|nr:hypothetical protein F383_09743 [Gossypium arboreum]